MTIEAQGFKYRCPECGTLNDDSSLTFPNCLQCRENLFKCSYCAYFPGAGRICPLFPRKPLTRADVVPDCPARNSRLRVGLRPLLLRPLGSGVGPFILTCTVFGLIVAVAAWFGPEPPKQPRGLHIEGQITPNPIRVGGTASLRLYIHNRDPQHACSIRLRLANDCFGTSYDEPSGRVHEPVYQCVGMTPVAVNEISSGSKRLFHFKPIEPQQTLSIEMRFRALKEGENPILVESFSEGEQMTNSFPLIVSPAPPVADRRANGSRAAPVAPQRKAASPIS